MAAEKTAKGATKKQVFEVFSEVKEGAGGKALTQVTRETWEGGTWWIYLAYKYVLYRTLLPIHNFGKLVIQASTFVMNHL